MVEYVLLIHGSLLAAAAAELIRCMQNSYTATVHQHAVSAIDRLRFRLIEELRSVLRPVFKDTDVIRVCGILDDHGDPWKTETGDPEKTEAFRNAISSFIDYEKGTVADYAILRASHGRWMSCTNCIGYIALGATIWQLSVCIGVGISSKLWEITPTNVWLTISAVPTAMLIMAYLIVSGVRMWLNNRIMGVSGRYA